MNRDNLIMIILFVSVVSSIPMYTMTADTSVLWHPYPYAQDVAIHPQPWYHMGYLRGKSMLLILALTLVWNPGSLRYWMMLMVFFLLEILDVIDYFFRYGIDFFEWVPGLDMNTVKIPVYLVFIAYNIRRNNRQLLKYAKE